MSFDSSVGRAVDCRGVEIHRSLVRIRLEGKNFFLFIMNIVTGSSCKEKSVNVFFSYQCICGIGSLPYLSLRTPVKMRQLKTDDSDLTPRQRMEQRKKQRADEEAEKRRRWAAQNFSERQQRMKERKKQQVELIS